MSATKMVHGPVYRAVRFLFLALLIVAILTVGKAAWGLRNTNHVIHSSPPKQQVWIMGYKWCGDSSLKFFAYSGSLTTPPCSEDVQWIVMLAEDPVSKPEVQGFQAKYPNDARPVQPLQGRTVEVAP